jgi:dolichol-phosphate mannosyltransferase
VELTLLITTINESDNLKVLLPRLSEHLDREKISREVLIIDGGSTDGTVETARSHGCRVESQSGPGYAQAIRDGLRLARGKYVIVMDADGSHPPGDVVRLYQHRNSADIVINSRYVKGGRSDTVWWRNLLSAFLNLVYRVSLGLPFKEVSGGFRIYRREIFSNFTLDSRFYEVQEELLIKPYWLGFTAIEIPYVYRERMHGVSKAKIFSYGFHLLLAILRFRKVRRQMLAARSRPVVSPVRGAK